MKLILPTKKNREQGQVLLVLLLVISVILVVGLSVVSRSVTDIKISQQSQESARALLVAQTGLEKAIKANSLINNESVSGINYSVAKAQLGNNTEYVFPNLVSANERVTLWLVDHNPDGSLSIPNPRVRTLQFGWAEKDTGDSQTALEATLIYERGGIFSNQRFVFDRNPSRTNFDGTVVDDCIIGGTTFANCSGTILILPGPGTPYLVQLRLLFNDQKQKIGFKSLQTLPEQGSCYVSTATVQESGVTRSLQQCQLWKTVPSIFNYQLFSGGDL